MCKSVFIIIVVAMFSLTSTAVADSFTEREELHKQAIVVMTQMNKPDILKKHKHALSLLRQIPELTKTSNDYFEKGQIQYAIDTSHRISEMATEYEKLFRELFPKGKPIQGSTNTLVKLEKKTTLWQVVTLGIAIMLFLYIVLAIIRGVSSCRKKHLTPTIN